MTIFFLKENLIYGVHSSTIKDKFVKIRILYRIMGNRWNYESWNPTLFEEKKNALVCQIII